jgi:serpin B
MPEIVTPQDLQAADLLLVDAVYFKGKWSNPFKEESTSPAIFTLLDASSKTVQMMEREGNYIYTEDKQLQAIALPYGKGRMDMIVVLPRENGGLPALQKSMNDKAWGALLRRMAKREGLIKLPRFEITYEGYLNEALKGLGMKTAFDPGADFSDMSNRGLWLALIKHKSYLRVTEKTTEAAAVTVAVGSEKAAREAPPARFQMIVDHPFLLGIVDTQTGALVFLGGIVDPKETRAGE